MSDLKAEALKMLKDESFQQQAAQPDSNLMFHTVESMIEQGWLDTEGEHVFVHDETNFYPENVQVLIGKLIDVLED